MPPTGAEQHRGAPAKDSLADGGSGGPFPLVQLNDDQRMVFDCLQQAGGGLTQRQISLRVSCSPPAVEQALSELVTLSLVARLNTLIPSYTCKYPGVSLHGE